MLIFMVIVAIALGLLSIFNPSFAWNFNEGWKVNGDSEPSSTYLSVTKFYGLISSLFGLLLLISGILKLTL
ncbi:hypothetical protein PGLA_07590 [Paenibacillus glacialis]|uniref:DUF6199 domain-containing protein n=2 Tax=Paenibacillus glacialis TaxID=494026 RepID=A0A168MF55_9BACL|nr:hypothetical protein PGLA_07590 [Paenibacillus glacialis]